MTIDTFVELINDKDLKDLLKFMREYENILKSGEISYDQLYGALMYDYKVFLEKAKNKRLLSDIDLSEPYFEEKMVMLNDVENIQTNISSKKDFNTKKRALILANRLLEEEQSLIDTLEECECNECAYKIAVNVNVLSNRTIDKQQLQYKNTTLD